MTLQGERVAVVRGSGRHQNVYETLDMNRADVIPRLREQVMVKPNFVSSTNQLASTHVGAVHRCATSPRYGRIDAGFVDSFDLGMPMAGSPGFDAGEDRC